ncbi:MAG: LysR substrate-binding domain-containing protein [Myxococcota bacterium]
MDRLESLDFFIQIIERGGVAAAGRDLGLSAAASSARLAALERHYGVTLLARTTRSFSLTEEGRMLLEGARTLVDDARELEALLRHGAEQLSGRIRVQAPEDLGVNRLAAILDAFAEEHPNVSLELNLHDGWADLAGAGFDLAFRYGALKDSSMVVRRLASSRRLVCASPAYLQARGAPVHPNELGAHNCLVMQFGDNVDRSWTFNVDGEEQSIAVTGNRLANNGGLVRRWCLEGRGLALKSYLDVAGDLESGALVEVLGAFASQQPYPLQIAYPGTRTPNRRVRALIDFVFARFPKLS